MTDKILHITNSINFFFVIDMKNILDPAAETMMNYINEKKYNFGIIVNNPSDFSPEKIFQVPCFSITAEEKYYALDIFYNNTKKIKNKFVFINLVKLIRNKLDKFFVWFENQLGNDLNACDNVFIVSNHNPFSILQMDISNTHLNKFLNIMFEHKHNDKFLYLTSYNKEQFLDFLLIPLWHLFSDKIKMINIDPLNTNKSYEFISQGKNVKKSRSFNEANFYFNSVSYSFLEFDSTTYFLSEKWYAISLANVTKFIIGEMIKLAKDIKLYGFTEKRKNIFEWYNSYAIKYGCFVSYEKITKNDKLLSNILRKNFLTNAIAEMRKCNIKLMETKL